MAQADQLARLPAFLLLGYFVLTAAATLAGAAQPLDSGRWSPFHVIQVNRIEFSLNALAVEPQQVVLG
jgi:hypothetical protein